MSSSVKIVSGSTALFLLIAQVASAEILPVTGSDPLLAEQGVSIENAGMGTLPQHMVVSNAVINGQVVTQSTGDSGGIPTPEEPPPLPPTTDPNAITLNATATVEQGGAVNIQYQAGGPYTPTTKLFYQFGENGPIQTDPTFDGQLSLTGLAAGSYDLSVWLGDEDTAEISDTRQFLLFEIAAPTPDPEPVPDPEPTPDPEPAPDPDCRKPGHHGWQSGGNGHHGGEARWERWFVKITTLIQRLCERWDNRHDSRGNHDDRDNRRGR